MPSKQGAFEGAVYRDAESGLRTNVAPLFLTYFMMDWAKVSQTTSGTKCVSCGGSMMSIEPISDKKGVVFDGLVCHKCKTVLWARRKSSAKSD